MKEGEVSVSLKFQEIYIFFYKQEFQKIFFSFVVIVKSTDEIKVPDLVVEISLVSCNYLGVL